MSDIIERLNTRAEDPGVPFEDRRLMLVAAYEVDYERKNKYVFMGLALLLSGLSLLALVTGRLP